ncbi:hypothetical protein [Paenibacillus sp. GYB003]|uniref:hypothetical protein n=1 Tax=Paenibacillus sp. GYB003 TaxID=2994392 RepID=UPI002F96CE5E
MEFPNKPVNAVSPMMSMPNMVSPAATMPANVNAPYENIAPAYTAPYMPVHVSHCYPKAPAYSSAGTILVLFILLVIISRGCKY